MVRLCRSYVTISDLWKIEQMRKVRKPCAYLDVKFCLFSILWL